MSKPVVEVAGIQNRRGSPSRRTERPSLEAPPVYRRFLAGGSESLQPKWICWLVLSAAGLGLLAIGWPLWALQDMGSSAAFLATALGGLVGSIVMVWFASRWLGRRLGLLAGLAWLSSVTVLGGRLDTWLAAVVCMAIGCFATAEVPGRLPPPAHRAVRWAFFALLGLSLPWFGPVALIVSFTVCATFVAIHQNVRSFRFLLDPVGLGILGAAIAGQWLIARLTSWTLFANVFDSRTLASPWARDAATWEQTMALGLGVLPWLLFAGVALVVGGRQGYYAMAFWRLMGCWILTSVGLATLGAINETSLLAVMAQPVCILAAAGLEITTGRIGRTRSSERT